MSSLKLKNQWYDYGARFYDPVIGRFHTVDPMTDFTSGISPFSYADNNPIKYIDYYGLGKDDPRKKWWKKMLAKMRHNRQKRKMNYKKPRGKIRYKPKLIPYSTAATEELPQIAKVNENIVEPDIPEFNFPSPPDFMYDFSSYVAEEPTSTPKTPTKKSRHDFETGLPIDAYSRPVKFHASSDRIYNTPITQNILTALIVSLHADPKLKLVIIGNMSNGTLIQGSSDAALNQSGVYLNGDTTTAGALMDARATAIYNWLISNGIASDRLKHRAGEVRDDGSGFSTDFNFYK